MRREDGTQCEAILWDFVWDFVWDFAGQPDYRLVHALFVDDADLALVLFDASDLRDPLHGVGFWLKQLHTGPSRCPIVLVAAQTDRGSCSLTREELRNFCQAQGIEGPIETSALTGQGLDELVVRMQSLIPWEGKAATVTTIQLSRQEQAQVYTQRQSAEQRTRFEQAVFQVQAYAAEQEITPPECFVSYAWGVQEHERWVEKRLATDLQKAGIRVLLDRWDNAQIGSSVARFVERIEECGYIVVVGTPLYRQKAKNLISRKGSVVAAEWDLAGIRMLATEMAQAHRKPGFNHAADEW